MILTRPSATVEFMAGTPKSIEEIGRTCYKSEDKITDESADKFVRNIIERGHHSVIEHSMATVRFIIDRGVSHELVRHRLCAFSQESTRYCNYKGGVEFIIPPWLPEIKEGEYDWPNQMPVDPGFGSLWTDAWLRSIAFAEARYIELLNDCHWSPQQARSVLPNSLKTEIVVTANYREWQHIFNLRCSPKAHPQMREVMIPLAKEFAEANPELFSGSFTNG